MSSVGARTSPRRGRARSGRPPRDTTAAMAAVFRGRPQRRRSPGAGTEVPDAAVSAHLWLVAQPMGHHVEAVGEQLDVEHVGSVELLVGREEVEEQRGRGPRALQLTAPRTGCAGCGGCCRCRARTHDAGCGEGNREMACQRTPSAVTTTPSSCATPPGTSSRRVSLAESTTAAGTAASSSLTTSSSDVWENCRVPLTTAENGVGVSSATTSSAMAAISATVPRRRNGTATRTCRLRALAPTSRRHGQCHRSRCHRRRRPRSGLRAGSSHCPRR